MLTVFLYNEKMTLKERITLRQSGILMHITSLPGPYGIGTMGKEAFRFVDFLQEAGQSCWQILPLSPTGFGDSPYQSCSTYAGNPYLIDLSALVEEGLLKREELDAVVWCSSEEKVDFGLQYNNKLKVLRLAFERFQNHEALDAFCMKNSSWLSDYTLFMALKAENGGKSWYEWEEGLKTRDPEAVWQARQKLHESLRFYSFVQFLFYSQWEALHSYARSKGISIIGDVPIYVPLDSVEVWTAPELFQLDENLMPTAIAGCPPDGFTADGQLWGNPLYRWDYMADHGYNWWIRRMHSAGTMYDVVRLDHFRGFESYWSVPYGDTTARNGKWVKGGGLAFIQALQEALPDLKLIAEDLGFLTPEVLAMRDASGLPGMKILEFAFYDRREPSDYLPIHYTKNCVVYTGTHDNVTAQEWFDTTEQAAVDYAKEYMNLSESEGLVWGMIRTAMSSVADTCIVQLQDYLALGGEARMNCPGLLSDKNWTWRVKSGMTTAELAKKIRRMTDLYARIPGNTTNSDKEI